MKTRHTVLLVLLALYALAGLSFGQTLRSLAYNTTNFTISGFTNTNALIFTNAIRVGGTTLSTNTNISALTYNTTNFTVVGWTSTNALTFANPVALPVGSGLSGLLETAEEEVRILGGLVLGANTATLQFGPGTNSFGIQFEVGVTTNGAQFGAIDFINSSVKSTTRSNLFGAPGIASIRLTNSGTVYVFTNGILASTNAP